MRQSLKGHALPESAEDAAKLAAQNALKFTSCLKCGGHLAMPAAASTPAGWRETQISRLCEPCFDKLMAEAQE